MNANKPFLEQVLTGIWRSADVTFPLQMCVWPSAGTELRGASTCAPPPLPLPGQDPKLMQNSFLLGTHDPFGMAQSSWQPQKQHPGTAVGAKLPKARHS